MADKVQWPRDATNFANTTTFTEAKQFLMTGQPFPFIASLVGSVEVNYKPIEKILGALTNLINDRFVLNPLDKKQKILVVPRGSFATHTAVKGHVDLDVDVIFKDDYEFDFGDRKTTIKNALGTDATGENILFNKDDLKRVLLRFYQILVSGGPKLVDPEKTLTAAQWILPHPDKPIAESTRSLSLQTTATDGIPSVPLDIFIKVRTTVREQDIILGLEKDSLLGARRYQTTSFIPTQGKWTGDHMLNAVDRVALLTLKWWKNDLKTQTTKIFKVRATGVSKPRDGPLEYNASKLEIKSHHLLASLNALHDLDVSDPLYVPEKCSEAFSLARVREVMIKILTYLDRAYHPESRNVIWWNEEQDLDYFIPPESFGTMERLFMQARANWDSYCYLIDSDIIASFRDELAKTK